MNKPELDDFLNLLWNEESFLRAYLLRSKTPCEIINTITLKDIDLWDYLFNDDFAYNEKLIILAKIIDYYGYIENDFLRNEELELGNSTLREIFGLESVHKFVTDSPAILRDLSNMVDEENLNLAVLVSDIKFVNVELDGVKNSVKDVIILNSKYEINSMMLQRLVGFANPDLSSEFTKRNYSVIKKTGGDILEYILKNIIKYVSDVFLQLPENTCEPEDIIVEIMDLLKYDVDLSKKIIDKETIKFGSLCQIYYKQYNDSKIEANREAVIDYCLFRNKVFPSWENIDSYWENQGITKELLQFIDRNADELTNRENTLSIEVANELLNSEINNDVFRKFVHYFDMNSIEIDKEKLSEAKRKILANRNLTFS